MPLFSNITREANFLTKQRYILALFSIVFLLSVFAIWSGISETRFQLSTIERLQEKDTIDRESVLAKQKDYGSAAYYSFHLTYSAPSAIAFAAMGQRDIYPWKHRIRMLAIEGQIYETDADNPELSFLGRFDFAFLISVLLPLFVILLLHDLRSAEREAGRYDLLITTARKRQRLWLSRAIVLCSALAIVLLIPFIVGALITQAPLASVGLVMLVVIAHLLFWMLLTFGFTTSKISAKQSSAKIASMLLAIWLVVTVLIPVSSDFVIDKMVESPNGGEIVLTQREAVNDAWDLPFNATWNEFLSTHPQWEDKTEIGDSFEWKWYYAFQQVGDQKAEELSKAYRTATLAKNTLAERFALMSPPMLTQRLMSSIAETDTNAAIRYELKIREYHKALRQFYYPLMFNETEFTLETLSGLPKFPNKKI
jgi:ABC-2 type transport system permease protein|tara:strand:+ start:5424 stop:6695 length:1272 start_codon:yes stop_codon:yes gene_type:complete